MLVFKVCSWNRTKTVGVTADENSPTIIEDVVSVAKSKLLVNGKKLVLDKDGTLIDENVFLTYWHEEIFMLLDEGENWPSTSETFTVKTSPDNADSKSDDLSTSSEENCTGIINNNIK